MSFGHSFNAPGTARTLSEDAGATNISEELLMQREEVRLIQTDVKANSYKLTTTYSGIATNEIDLMPK